MLATRWPWEYVLPALEFRQGGYQNMELREMLCDRRSRFAGFVDIDAGHRWGRHLMYLTRIMRMPSFVNSGKAARLIWPRWKPNRQFCLPGVSTIRCWRRNCFAMDLRSGRHGASGIADPGICQQGTRGPPQRDPPLYRLYTLYRRGVGTRHMPYTPTCSINPVIGRELFWKEQFQPAQQPKKVVVVGGGIAGCEAARVAAMRGHQVILLEQGKRLGANC